MYPQIQVCAVCGQPMIQIPAGVSKTTGRPYQAFMACPNRCKQPKPVIQQPAQPRSPQLPQNYEYGQPSAPFQQVAQGYQPPTPKVAGDQIIIELLQTIQNEAKDYFKQLNDQQNYLLTKIVGLEKTISDNILGEAGLGEETDKK